MKRLRIGVLGVGRMGILHAKNVSGSASRAELVAVADPIKKLSRMAARKFGVRAYDSATEMLRKEELDGVLIVTPTSLHAKHVALAAEASVPILLEKPIALTLKDAHKIVSIVRRSGVKFQLGYNRRFDRSYQKTKRMILDGSIGKPIMVKTCARDPAPPPEEYIAVSGGMFVDECIHDIDIALWLMSSRVKRVSAVGRTLIYPQFAKYGDYDNAIAILHFKTGALGIIEGSRTSKYGYDLRSEVLGSQGAVTIGNWKTDSARLMTKQGTIDEPYPWFWGRFAEAYKLELEAFYDYISHDTRSPISAEEGQVSLQVALAATESARTEEVVTIH